MEFLYILIGYCLLFIIGSLCLLYRDSAIFCSGPVGHVRNFVIECIASVVPSRLQTGAVWICNYLLYTRTSIFQVTFAVLCILGHLVWLVDMIPILYSHYPNYNHTFWPPVVIFVNYFCWHKAWTGDPGEITQKNHSNYMKVYDYDGILYKKDVICSTCNFVKPARSKHCSICNRCVHRFDHHCIWTNNCVGALNTRFFILFMVTLIVMFLQGVYVGGGCLLDYAEDVRLFNASYIQDGIVMPMTLPVAFQHLFMALPRLVFLVISLAVLTILVAVFLCHHLYLVLTNQTSNERSKIQALTMNGSHKLQPMTDCSNRQSKVLQMQNNCDSIPSNIDRKLKPYSQGMINNFMEVFLPHRYIQLRIKKC